MTSSPRSRTPERVRGLDPGRRRLDEEPVAREDAGRVAVDEAHGRRAAAVVAEVDDVVVEERRVVDELDGDRAVLRGVAEAAPGAGREGDADRPDALARRVEEVAPRALGERLAAIADGGEGALDVREVAREPDAELAQALRESVGLALGRDALEAVEHGDRGRLLAHHHGPNPSFARETAAGTEPGRRSG